MTTHIRIPAVAPSVQTVADGTAKTFEFPFPIFSATDLDVRVGDAAVTSGFTVRGAGSTDGGAILFATAPANGQRVTIRRRQTYARTSDFLDERAPTPHELNDAVDQNVAAIQELADESALAVKRSATSDLSRPVSLVLPEPESGKVIGWNGSANALVNLTQVDVSDMLHKSQNLADLPDKAQARINLGLGSAATHADTDFATSAQGAKADTALQSSALDTDVALSANSDVKIASQKAVKAYVDNAVATGDAADLKKAQNLADLNNLVTARSNLGLGSAATHADTDFATSAQGAKADTALQSSALDTDVALSANSDEKIASQKAVKAYVDSAVATGDAADLKKAQNLADLNNLVTARSNLGLGSAATHAEGDFATAAQGSKADTALQASAIGVSVQAHDEDLTWVAANVTAAGKALLDDADAAAQRATLSLGSAAIKNVGTSADDVAAGNHGHAGAYEPVDASILRAPAIGATVQGYDDDLTWVAGNLSAAGKALLDDADAAAQRATLGLGSAATKDVGTSANQVVQLDASAKLPAVDGSAVTNLNASSLSTGTVPAARLGSGTADASTFLRGDGTWTALSAISGSAFTNVQTFTSSGTFTVPAGVTLLIVNVYGGGGAPGGTGGQSSPGATGGTSSFGSYVVAPGGGGGPSYHGNGPTQTSGPGDTKPAYVAAGVLGTGTSYTVWPGGTPANITAPYGAGVSSFPWGANLSSNAGAVALALVPVTPGQAVTVTVGTGIGGGGNGAVIVRW